MFRRAKLPTDNISDRWAQQLVPQRAAPWSKDNEAHVGGAERSSFDYLTPSPANTRCAVSSSRRYHKAKRMIGPTIAPHRHCLSWRNIAVEPPARLTSLVQIERPTNGSTYAYASVYRTPICEIGYVPRNTPLRLTAKYSEHVLRDAVLWFRALRERFPPLFRF